MDEFESDGPATGPMAATVHTASGRVVRLPIGRPQFRSLLAYLDEVVMMHGCDNTLHLAEGWARAHGFDWGRLSRSLRGLGAFCDCEVAMNIAESEVSEQPGR